MSSYGVTFKGVLSQNNNTSRLIDMQIIEDLRSGNGFKHFKNRYINDATLKEEEDILRKKYCSMNDMDAVIKELVSFCPDLSTFVPRDVESDRGKAQHSLVQKALKEIKWTSRLNNIYDTLESKGDCYFYIYFDSSEDKIPKLKYLDPKYITDIILDNNGQTSAIIYKEKYIQSVVGINGEVSEMPEIDVVWVFQKGLTQVYKQNLVQDKKTKKFKAEISNNRPVYGNPIDFPNRASYINDLAVIRISSFLKENSKFSEIPASSYIEPCLMLDKINSNLHQVNMLLGFPQTYIVDGEVTRGERKAGGFVYVKSLDGFTSQAKVEDKQISNGLDSIFEEKALWLDNLRGLAGLVSRTLQLKLGSSDSSRVVKQLNAPMENKIELYVDNIITAMELYFKILLKENGLYDEVADYGVSLFKPPFIVKVSIFDQQIYEQNELNKGTKTKTEVALERNDSYTQIENRESDEEELEETESNAESVDQVRSANNM